MLAQQAVRFVFANKSAGDRDHCALMFLDGKFERPAFISSIGRLAVQRINFWNLAASYFNQQTTEFNKATFSIVSKHATQGGFTRASKAY